VLDCEARNIWTQSDFSASFFLLHSVVLILKIQLFVLLVHSVKHSSNFRKMNSVLLREPLQSQEEKLKSHLLMFIFFHFYTLIFKRLYYRIIVVLGGTLIRIYLVKFTPLSFSFILLPPFLKFQQVSFFHFHTWVHNISTIFTLLQPFLTSSPPHHWCQPSDRTSFSFLFSTVAAYFLFCFPY
jgi:hypothetical protein